MGFRKIRTTHNVQPTMVIESQESGRLLRSGCASVWEKQKIKKMCCGWLVIKHFYRLAKIKKCFRVSFFDSVKLIVSRILDKYIL